MSSATRSEPPVRRSIFATIIALMTIAMSVLFVGFAAFQLSASARTQQRDHEQYVTTTLHFVRAELEGELEEGDAEQEELDEIEDVVLRENATRRFGRLVVHVTDESGKVLLATSGATELTAENPPFPPLVSSPGSASISYWESPRGNHYVLSSLRTTAPDGRVREVRLAIDWSEAEDRFEALRRRSLAAAFLCTILAAIAAAFVTRLALRPLNVIREAAESIRLGSFDATLEPDKLPAEIADLAHSFDNMQTHLEEQFERLSQFAAELAHELRTPVNNLMGQTEVALSQTRSSGEYREVLESNLEEMARLSRMIDSLLFLARAARGSGRAETEVASLGDEVDLVIEYHRAQAEEAGVVLTRKGDATAPVDRTLLRRALSNLLSNAIDASSPGGKVTVSIVPDGGSVDVAVTDEGIGILPEEIHRVFERFYRSQDSRARRPEGSGLGLAIVKSIAELHGGSISIESEPGRATTATLRLPCRG